MEEVNDVISSLLWSSLTGKTQVLKLKLKKMLYNIGAFTWWVCDNDNGIWGARNMWTRTWQRSIQGRRPAREGQSCLYWLKLFFLLANNLLTLFSIYWLEDAALNQLVSQRATKRLIDFVRGITSFSGKGLTSTQAWRGSVRCPSLDADCKHFCLLCAKALNLHFCFEKNKKIKKTTLICKDCRNQTSLVW